MKTKQFRERMCIMNPILENKDTSKMHLRRYTKKSCRGKSNFLGYLDLTNNVVYTERGEVLRASNMFNDYWCERV